MKKNLQKEYNYALTYSIILKGYDKKILELNFISVLFELKKLLNFIKIDSIIFSPKKIKKFSILRSSFVDSISKEILEIQIHRVFFKIHFLGFNNKIYLHILNFLLQKILSNQEVSISFKKQITFIV